MIDSVAAGILLEIVGGLSYRFRWSLDPDVRYQDLHRNSPGVDAGAGRDRWLSSRCRVSTPPSPSETKVRHIESGIDTLDLFADDPAVLCQIEKRALLSHIQDESSLSETVISRSCEDNTISECTDVNY